MLYDEKRRLQKIAAFRERRIALLSGEHPLKGPIEERLSQSGPIRSGFGLKNRVAIILQTLRDDIEFSHQNVTQDDSVPTENDSFDKHLATLEEAFKAGTLVPPNSPPREARHLLPRTV